jgi:protein-tyrosine phosphatase
VIDLHSHVLPGIDDGAETLTEAIAICQAAAADGITVLAATPHVRNDFPTTAEMIERALAELQTATEGILRVVPGAEFDLQELDRPREELARFGLAGNPAYLLVEVPYVGWPLDLAERLFRLQIFGITPVLAHPERNPEVQSRPALLDDLVRGGALVQLTAAAVDGRLGSRAQRCTRALIDQGLAHLIASDAHSSRVRAIGMADAAKSVADADLARWLTVDVPGAIVSHAEIPPRPVSAKRRLFQRRSG